MPEELKTKLLAMVQGITLRKVDVDEPLLESGLVDSISAVDLALQMEAEFGVAMPAERIHEYMRTVRTLADHVLAQGLRAARLRDRGALDSESRNAGDLRRPGAGRRERGGGRGGAQRAAR